MEAGRADLDAGRVAEGSRARALRFAVRAERSRSADAAAPDRRRSEGAGTALWAAQANPQPARRGAATRKVVSAVRRRWDSGRRKAPVDRAVLRHGRLHQARAQARSEDAPGPSSAPM